MKMNQIAACVLMGLGWGAGSVIAATVTLSPTVTGQASNSSTTSAFTTGGGFLAVAEFNFAGAVPIGETLTSATFDFTSFYRQGSGNPSNTNLTIGYATTSTAANGALDTVDFSEGFDLLAIFSPSGPGATEARSFNVATPILTGAPAGKISLRFAFLNGGDLMDFSQARLVLTHTGGVAAVPTPTSAAMGVALMGGGLLRRRR